MPTISIPDLTCPDWCTDPLAHAEGSSPEHVTALVKNDLVTSGIAQRYPSNAWRVPVTFEPFAYLYVGGDEAATGLSSTQAREIARALLAAADKLDEINGGSA